MSFAIASSAGGAPIPTATLPTSRPHFRASSSRRPATGSSRVCHDGPGADAGHYRRRPAGSGRAMVTRRRRAETLSWHRLDSGALSGWWPWRPGKPASRWTRRGLAAAGGELEIRFGTTRAARRRVAVGRRQPSDPHRAGGYPASRVAVAAGARGSAGRQRPSAGARPGGRRARHGHGGLPRPRLKIFLTASAEERA